MADSRHLQAVPPNPRPARQLNSWKEIAAYLNRTVRTARRWEQQEGLPVHRHSHAKRDSVWSHTQELDEWWAQRSLRLERGAGVETAEPARPARRRFRLKAAFVTAALAAAALAGYLVRRFTVRPVAFSARDWILVADFENQSGEPLLDQSLWTAFTIGLQQSRHVNLLSRERVDAALRRMGRKPGAAVGETLGRELCLRENARALVVCRVSHAESKRLLAARIVEPRTGATLRAHMEVARDGPALLAALDKLARRIRKDLGESLGVLGNSEPPLPQVTTSSLEALRLYAAGARSWRAGKYQDAVGIYEAALQHDPDFALAHADLGAAYYSHIFNDRIKGAEHYRLALRRPERLTARERLLVEAAWARDLQREEDTVRAYRAYLALYPDDAAARYNLGSFLMRGRRYRDAIAELETAVKLEPDRTPALINLATAFRGLGSPREALSYYARAFRQEPSFLKVSNLAHEYAFTLAASGEAARAREVLDALAADPDTKAWGLRSSALLDMYYGEYRKARGKLEHSVLISEKRREPLSAARTHLFLAILFRSQGARAASLRELGRAAREAGKVPAPQPWLISRIGVESIRAGDLPIARTALTKLQALIDSRNAEHRAQLKRLEGELALARGDRAAALERLQLADEDAGSPETLLSLASAWTAAGENERALAALEKVVSMRVEPLGWEPQQEWLEAHLSLAQRYLDAGDNARAAGVLARLSYLRGSADPDHPLLRGLERLASLAGPPPT